ncbi:MAG TPA: TIGR02679 family protein [Chloroflexota bacterium]|jgi:uncharacterized protein (TIGR02679 family)
MTLDVDLARVQRLLGHADLQWIVDRARRRLESGRPLTGTLVLPQATAGQRRAVELLVGRPVTPGLALSIKLETIQTVLARAGAASDLRGAIESLIGPVVDRQAEQRATEGAWSDAFAPLEELCADRLLLARWLDSVRATGVLRRLAHGDPTVGLRLARDTARIVERLPCHATPLSVLASTATGDGHALDAGRPLSTLVIHAAACLGGVPEGHGAEWRRTVWASVGVLCGELTSPVLCLNLPADPSTPTGKALSALARQGEPAYITARQLLRDPPTFGALHNQCVSVCENPTVVAEAANTLGAACAPLVCASGHPAGAATLLLRMLLATGAHLRYHGDFDWPGITIANGLFSRFDLTPWRFDAPAYRAADRSATTPLRGRAVQATWDPALTRAMLDAGRKIEEERVLSVLLADLS